MSTDTGTPPRTKRVFAAGFVTCFLIILSLGFIEQQINGRYKGRYEDRYIDPADRELGYPFMSKKVQANYIDMVHMKDEIEILKMRVSILERQNGTPFEDVRE